MLTYFSNRADWMIVKRDAIKNLDNEVTKGNNVCVDGCEVDKFGMELKKAVGSKYCLLTKSGTQALAISLLANGIGTGDKVITTPYTFIATISAIKMVGAEPVFVDIKEDTWNIDENKIEEKITDEVKAILPVDIFGNPCNYDKILEIAKKYNLKVIEDACQSLTAEYNGKKIGNLDCDTTCVSFYPTKPFGGFGEGGAIFTNDDNIYEKCRSLLDHGSDGNNNCVMDGTNGAFDMLHASFLLCKMKYYNQVLRKRNIIANIYKQMKGIKWQKQEPNSISAWCRIQGYVEDEKYLDIIKKVFETDDLYCRDICDNTLYSQYRSETPVSEKISHHSISLPIYTYLPTERLQEAVNQYNLMVESN